MTDAEGVGVIYYLELNNCKTKCALCIFKRLLKCIVGSLISYPQSPKFLGKAIGRRLVLKKALTHVNNRLFIVQKQGKIGKPSGSLIDVQPEQSTADPAVLHSPSTRNDL